MDKSTTNRGKIVIIWKLVNSWNTIIFVPNASFIFPYKLKLCELYNVHVCIVRSIHTKICSFERKKCWRLITNVCRTMYFLIFKWNVEHFKQYASFFYRCCYCLFLSLLLCRSLFDYVSRLIARANAFHFRLVFWNLIVIKCHQRSVNDWKCKIW